ncbi:MAG: SH3 domain-containing protein [Chloroflexota bacterium]
MMRRFAISLALLFVGLGLVAAQVTPTAVCAPAPPSRLILRERARVSIGDPRPLNLRSGAGTANDVIAQIPASGVFYVLEGPQCSQNYAWFRVEYNGVAGWVAEGDTTAYYVEPYPPGQ